jgi:hypothetical protein
MKDLLYPLILLACPISTGLMMWFMMRGKHNAGNPPSATDAEVARLRTDLDQLRAQQHHENQRVGNPSTDGR